MDYNVIEAENAFGSDVCVVLIPKIIRILIHYTDHNIFLKFYVGLPSSYS